MSINEQLRLTYKQSNDFVDINDKETPELFGVCVRNPKIFIELQKIIRSIFENKNKEFVEKIKNCPVMTIDKYETMLEVTEQKEPLLLTDIRRIINWKDKLLRELNK